MPGGVVLLDQLRSFGIDQRIDDVVQSFGDDVPDLLDLPPCTQRSDLVTDTADLVLVCSSEDKDELGVGGLEDRATVDQSAAEEGPAECQRAGLRDDRFIEVEERCGASHRARIGRRPQLPAELPPTARFTPPPVPL